MSEQTRAKIGFGGIFYVHDDNSPGSYVKVGQVNSIEPPKISRDAIDATHSESPEGWREFIAGLKDGGEASCEINFDPGSAGMTLLMAQLADNQLSACKITIPTSPAYRWVFDAVLTGLEPAQPIDDKMVTTLTFKVSGKPTLELDT